MEMKVEGYIEKGRGKSDMWQDIIVGFLEWNERTRQINTTLIRTNWISQMIAKIVHDDMRKMHVIRNEDQLKLLEFEEENIKDEVTVAKNVNSSNKKRRRFDLSRRAISSTLLIFIRANPPFPFHHHSLFLPFPLSHNPSVLLREQAEFSVIWQHAASEIWSAQGLKSKRKTMKNLAKTKIRNGNEKIWRGKEGRVNCRWSTKHELL